MIPNSQIRHFRCLSDLHIENFRMINLIRCDKGSVKSSLLAALFFALASSSELGLRFRQQRGLEGRFAGGTRQIEEAIWRDLFHSSDWSKTISIELNGDGPAARMLRIFRGSPQLSIPLLDERQEQIS